MKKYILFPLLLIQITCTHSPKSKASQPSDTSAIQNNKTTSPENLFKLGEVIPSINLVSDSNQKFALYLPKNYSAAQRYPVIIFFDPHAEGIIPLNKYEKLAEKYQYILVASNTSKNGMDAETANKVANQLLQETKTRFSIDPLKITLCGFSGGAKVAFMIASENPDISRLIYCGAVTRFNPNHPIQLLGFAGNKDMNYTDLVSFEWSLEGAPFKHYLLEWKGKHEFPDEVTFENAFTFINTGSIDNYKDKMVSISASQVEEEQSHKQKYIDAFQSKDIGWWKDEIKLLNHNKKNNLMAERLLGFISLACYSLSNNSLAQNDLLTAERILGIYKLADPSNEACKEFIKELNQRKLRH